ncbi:MAG: LytS/YehU family sensor histidine kinase [Bacteroidia bacterium]|jgi:LytS/YehU family sensor histidine kinase
MPDKTPHIANSLLNSFKAFAGSHFLLNIINSIQSDVILKDTKSAFDTLQRFNRLYKLALRTSNDQLVPLNTEIDLVNEYIGLELIRFPKNKFPKVNVKGVQHDCLVPSFVFQSLIENAWLLSMESNSKSPKVSISTTETSVSLLIDLVSVNQLHPKVEAKINLALNRLDFLKDNIISNYQLKWGQKPFMTLTIFLK